LRQRQAEFIILVQNLFDLLGIGVHSSSQRQATEF